MFPSLGYFHGIICPDHEGPCSRVFCHFKHVQIPKINLNSAKSSQSLDNNIFNEAKEEVPLQKNISSFNNKSSDDSLDSSPKKLEIVTPQDDEIPDNEEEADQEGVCETETKDAIDQESLLQKLVSEAVKKLLAESPSLSSSLDAATLVKKMNAEDLSKALQQVTNSDNAPIQIQNKEKKKLYLPPPGTPSYNPTPISLLKNHQHKQSTPKPKLTSKDNDEYIPTPVAPIPPSLTSQEDENSTDFSPVEDEESDKRDSEFDLLEEVIAEHSSNPNRAKAIKKRKKAYAKLNPAKNSNLFVTLTKAAIDKKTCLEDVAHASMEIEEKSTPKLSPQEDTTKESPTTEIHHQKQQGQSSISHLSCQSLTIDSSKGCEDTAKEPITHRLLPKISHLTCPNTKEWVPVAKPLSSRASTYLNVEKMLEKLDGSLGEDDKFISSPIESENYIKSESLSKSIPTHEDLSETSKNVSSLPLADQSNEKDPSTQSDEKDSSSNSSQNEMEEECKSTKSDSKYARQSKRKNHKEDSSSSYETYRRKRRKKEKRSYSRKQKKRRYYSDSSEDLTNDDSHSENERKSQRKSKIRKSKHRKHHSRSHSHRKKSKRKQKKKSRYRSSSSDISDSEERSAKKDCRSKKKGSQSDCMPIPPEEIKQERIEIDLTIIKDEEEEKPVVKTEKKDSDIAKSPFSKSDITPSERIIFKEKLNLPIKEESIKFDKFKIQSCPETLTGQNNKDTPPKPDEKSSKDQNSSNALPQTPSLDTTKNASQPLSINANKSKSESSGKTRILKEISLFGTIMDDCSPKRRKSSDKHSKKELSTQITDKMPSPRKRSSSSSSSASKRHRSSGSFDDPPLENSSNSTSGKEKAFDKLISNKVKDKSTRSSYSQLKENKIDNSRMKSNEVFKLTVTKNKAGICESVGLSKENNSSSKSKEKEKGKHHHNLKSKTSEKKSESSSSKHHSSRSSSKSHRKSDSKESRSPSKKHSSHDKKVSSKKLISEEIPKMDSSHTLKTKDDNSSGSGSPIPDLSALNEIPNDEWNDLLCNSENTLECEISKDEPLDDMDPDPEPTSTSDLEHMMQDEFGSDSDDANDPQVMEECLKMFSEYKPEKSETFLPTRKSAPKRDLEVDTEMIVQKHKRLAHTGAPGNLITKPKISSLPKKKTPSEIMLERYQKLKEEEAALQKKLEQQRKEWQKYMDAPSSSPCISSSSVSSTSGCDDSTTQCPASSSTFVGKKRIARVPAPGKMPGGVLSKNKMKYFRIPPGSCSGPSSNQTTACMSNPKGNKRVAHNPTNLETLSRPIIQPDGKNKVPQNIRQRYLNCFIDEASKFCDSQSHSFKVALAEEKVCHNRASSRMVYLNLAVNTLKRLRSKTISESAQEILTSESKVECLEEPSSSSISSPQKSNPHPLNPNHKVVSHFSILSGGDQKGSWSIRKSKKALPPNIDEILAGPELYKLLKKYILNQEALEENGFPRPDSAEKGKALIKKLNSKKKVSPSETERYCARCHVLYSVDEIGLPLKLAPCVYHWGRPYKMRGFGGFETKYSCCQLDSSSDGCCQGSTHVSDNFSPDSLRGYVKTLPKEVSSDQECGIYALDCEMCYTTYGNELTRITVIGTDNKVIYETLVRPDNPIIDYNTRFSGITAEDLKGVTVTIRDVQAALLTRFSDKTILMGHSLESDFAALKMIHDTVVDTSIVFPHRLGLPFKRALRNLASDFLKKIIQNDVSGHDSAEDAITCMELMKWKVKEDLKLLKHS